MDPIKLVSRDPSELSVHPAAKPMPEWAKDDQRFIALVEDIRDRGIDQPLLIDKENRIVDGRHRWRGSKQLQLPEVMCRIVSDEEVASIILQSLLQRRHYTKGQLAYLAYPLMESAHEEAKRRRLQMLRKGQQIPVSHSMGNGKATSDFAAQIGVHRNTFDQAAKVHEAFKNTKKFSWNDAKGQLTLKEYYEPRILDAEDPIGLGAAIAGIGAKISERVQNQSGPKQLDLFLSDLNRSKSHWTYWSSFSPQERTAAREAIRKTVSAMPAELRQEWEKALKEAQNDTPIKEKSK